MSIVEPKPGSQWRSLKGRDVIVLGVTTTHVQYEEVPSGRSRATWRDRFLSHYDPVRAVSFHVLRGRMSKSARAGQPVTLSPGEVRLLLRNLSKSKSPATTDAVSLSEASN